MCVLNTLCEFSWNKKEKLRIPVELILRLHVACTSFWRCPWVTLQRSLKII